MSRLSDLLFGNRFVEIYDIGGHKFELQSLWKSEEIEVLRKAQSGDIMDKFEMIKVPTLARAIVSIDKVPLEAVTEVVDEKKKDSKIDTFRACEIVLGYQDGGFIDLLYLQYVKLKESREKEREKLSANFTQALGSGASTDSVSSSDVSPKN